MILSNSLCRFAERFIFLAKHGEFTYYYCTHERTQQALPKSPTYWWNQCFWQWHLEELRALYRRITEREIEAEIHFSTTFHHSHGNISHTISVQPVVLPLAVCTVSRALGGPKNTTNALTEKLYWEPGARFVSTMVVILSVVLTSTGAIAPWVSTCTW